MKTTNLIMRFIIIFILLSTVGTSGCKEKTEYGFCAITGISDPIPMGKLPPAETDQSVNLPSWTLTYNPLLLPFKIKFNLKKGFFVEASDNEELATPIGVFGLDYSYASEGTINGVEITKSDFVVAIINRNLNSKQLFKIKGYNKLKVILSGKTIVDAQAGFVQIDATSAHIDEITFFDNSRGCIENLTDKTVPFKFEVTNNKINSAAIYSCELPAKTYKLIDLELLNRYITQEVHVTINNDDISNDTRDELSKKITYGDLCLVYNEQPNKLGLKKFINTQSYN